MALMAIRPEVAQTENFQVKVSSRQIRLGKTQGELFEFCFEHKVVGDACTSLEEKGVEQKAGPVAQFLQGLT